MDKQDVQHKQTVNNADTMESNSKYEAGDIVWAKLTGCPYWPSIVTYDPVSRLCIKGKKKTFALHVRFCSYFGQRNWAKIVEKYISKEDFVSKHPDYMVPLKKNKNEIASWNAAVQEADYLMTLERKERMLHFCSLYNLDYSNELDINGSSDDPAPQTSNLNSSKDFHDATPIYNTENIQNNDTTKTPDHDDDDDTSDHDDDAADGPTNSELISSLLISKYGISENDPQSEFEEGISIDFDNLVPRQGTYRVPEELKDRISEFEKKNRHEFSKKKKMNTRHL